MKILSKILKFGILLTGIGLTVAYFVPGSGATKIGSYVATMILPFVVDIMKLFKLKFSARLELAYLLFLIPAMVLGIDFRVYEIVYPFDKIVHTLSGVLAAFTAREIIDQTSFASVKERWVKVMFVFCFVAMTAVIWECFEFLMDQVMGLHMQQLIVSGVEDTMYDMIVAMIGGVVGIVMLYAGEKGKKR